MKRQHLLEFFIHNSIKTKLKYIATNRSISIQITVHSSLLIHTRGGARNPPGLKIQTT